MVAGDLPTLSASEPNYTETSTLTTLFQNILGVKGKLDCGQNTSFPSAFSEESQLVTNFSGANSELAKSRASTNHGKKRKKIRPPPFKHSKSVTYPENFDSKFLLGFENIKPLGRGGYGKVFQAKRKDDKINYAVKYVQLPDDKEEKEKVLREWQALSHLKHANIMQLFDTWTENLTGDFFENLQKEVYCSDDEECFSLGASSCNSSLTCGIENKCGLFMQVELCDITLTEWLEKNLSRTKRMYYGIFRQIVEALDFIHKSKLIHRDIKPSNIFLIQNIVKVGDFGLVKGIHNSYNQYLSTESLNTMDLDLYVAPELKLGKSYKPTCKVDIYSLGLILLEMIMKCKTVHEKMNLLCDARNFKFPDGFQQGYPKQSEFIRSTLESDSSLRPSAAEILRNNCLRKTQQKKKNLRMKLQEKRQINVIDHAQQSLQKKTHKPKTKAK